MIPRTYPSSEIDGIRAMTVNVLSSVAGLTQWVDYIPVKSRSEPSVIINSYSGAVLASQHPDPDNAVAWTDYIPVYIVDYPEVKQWRSDNDGFIPLFGLYSPLSLFRNGEQGAWYDPSDLTTLFQNSAGTTPVTAVEQPVGLMLDKSKGLVLGSELVTNGDFIDGGTGWAAPIGVTFSSETAVFTAVANGSNLNRNCNTVAASSYRITYTIVSISSGGFQAMVGGNVGTLRTTPGTYSEVVVAGSSATFTGVKVFSGVTTAVIDNISVRELPGNHAFNPNATTVRPTLSARYNLLERTEEFDNAYWSKIRTSVSGAAIDAIIAPDGTVTADKVVEDTSVLNTHTVNRIFGNPLPVGTYTYTVYAKADGRRYLQLTFTVDAVSTNLRYSVMFDLQDGAITDALASTPGPTATASAITPVGTTGWYRCSITVGNPSGQRVDMQHALSNSPFITIGPLAVAYTGDGTSGIYLWGADLRVANESATIPYQRVVTATDYDADPTKFPYYLRFDGSDDWLQTASIDFSTVTSDGLPRRNLLSFPTAFDDAAWTKTGLNTTGTPPWVNVIAAPDGTLTADRLIEDTSNALRSVTRTVVGAGSDTYTLSFYAKDAGRQWVGAFITHNFGDTAYCAFDLTNGTANVPTVTWASVATASVESVGGGWLRCVLTITTPGFTSPYVLIQPLLGTATSRQTYTGDGTSGIYIWGAQLETGSTATAFQNIGTDKMSVFAGVRKLSDATSFATVSELSVDAAGNAGTFIVRAPQSGASYAYFSRGNATIVGAIASTGYTAPITNILTGLSDISGDSTTLRINGAVAATNTGDQGTGNFGNYPLYIGRRAGSSLPFNGRLYSLIVRGALSDATEIANAETYVAGKTGVTL